MHTSQDPIEAARAILQATPSTEAWEQLWELIEASSEPTLSELILPYCEMHLESWSDTIRTLPEQAWEQLWENKPTPQSIRLVRSLILTEIQDEDLQRLLQWDFLPHIKTLDASYTSLTEEGFCTLFAHPGWTSLESIDLRGNQNLTAAAMDALPTLLSRPQLQVCLFPYDRTAKEFQLLEAASWCTEQWKTQWRMQRKEAILEHCELLNSEWEDVRADAWKLIGSLTESILDETDFADCMARAKALIQQVERPVQTDGASLFQYHWEGGVCTEIEVAPAIELASSLHFESGPHALAAFLSTCTRLHFVSSLSFGYRCPIDTEFATLLGQCPSWTSLKSFYCCEGRWTPETLTSLFANDGFPALSSLELLENGFDDECCLAMQKARIPKTLTQLILNEHMISTIGVGYLLESPWFSQLKTLSLESYMDRKIDEIAALLAASPACQTLEVLGLGYIEAQKTKDILLASPYIDDAIKKQWRD